MLAVFFAPTVFGVWFPGRNLVPALPLLVPLVAFGMRRLPRLGALLGAIGVAASVWLVVAVRFGDAGTARDLPDAPWGPLDIAFPRFDGDTLAYVVAGAALAALAIAFLVPPREWRKLANAARTGAPAR
jgi:hypothetical protein